MKAAYKDNDRIKTYFYNPRRRQLIFRRFAIIAAIIISTAAVIGLSRISTHAEELNTPHYYKYYTSIIVMPGDTLESIADTYSVNYASSDDHVREIMAANHMTDTVVYAGSSLIVPYYSTQYIY